jgi:hypothetical protein
MLTFTPEGCSQLDELLSTQSYVDGHVPSSLDAQLHAHLTGRGVTLTAATPHLCRWLRHLSSFSETEKRSFVFSASTLENFISSPTFLTTADQGQLQARMAWDTQGGSETVLAS